MYSNDKPHRRMNPLTGQWILVSPHRTLRPWQGKIEETTASTYKPYEPNCYLCPGNKRAGDCDNPEYTDTYVFDNDYPALLQAEDSACLANSSDKLFQQVNVAGSCKVICYSSRHDMTMAKMPRQGIRRVIDIWVEQTKALGKTYQWVQVFENKGAIMGCSNPHPHGQIWTSNQLPDIPAIEDTKQADYKKELGSVLLLDYVQRELESRERIVVETKHWLAVVPYWATWPFETILMPKRHVQRLPDLLAEERCDLADALKRLLTRYDNLFQTSFPYSMGWHGAPFVDRETSHWQLHAHFFPPLLRSAIVKKFMVGYEMLGEPQRDLTPEQAAARLRSVTEQHYLDQ